MVTSCVGIWRPSQSVIENSVFWDVMLQHRVIDILKEYVAFISKGSRYVDLEPMNMVTCSFQTSKTA
jgi:hypothetical protein